MQLSQMEENRASAPNYEDAAQILTHLLETEKSRTCGDESKQSYAGLHRSRFGGILRICRSEVPNPLARVLDIGRSELTAYLTSFYRNVQTLGLDLTVDDGGHRETRKLDAVPHIAFDLLNSPVPSNWPKCGNFDLVVFSELIEHLHVAPEFVLACLCSLLADKGILICTTPNAADIGKRVKLTLEFNPYERIRLYPTNPGHFREYTRQELCEIAESIGLRCKSHFYFNWIEGSGSPVKIAVLKLLRAVPSFRLFQACVFSRN